MTISKNGLKDSENVMFFGALQPYIKNTQVSICPSIGPTNWSTATNVPNTGITWNTPYDKSYDTLYYNSLGQMAVNIFVVDWNAYWDSSFNMRSGASRSRIAAIKRPAETILFTAESSWDWGPMQAAGVGNGGVWPGGVPGNACEQFWGAGEGWVWYVHKGGRGSYNGAVADRAEKNPNLQGFANFGFCDGHVKSMKMKYAERCESTPNGETISKPDGETTQVYFPSWTPDI